MTSRIEAFCKFLSPSNSRHSSNILNSQSSLKVNSNRVSTSNGKSSEFVKVFTPDSKNTNELYSSTCGALGQHFLNGFNTSLLLFGSEECLQSLLVDGKGPFIYLTEHLSHLSGKQLKNKKSSPISSDKGSLPYLNTKNDVLMRIYTVDDNGIHDLSHSPSFSSFTDVNPCLEGDVGSGHHIKNIRGYSIIENSSKESCRYLSATLRNTNVSSLPEKTCLVVEFALTKMTEYSSVPLSSWFRILMLSTNKEMKIVEDLCDDIVFQRKLMNYSSMDTLTLYLSDMIGGNCVSKAIVFMKESDSILTEVLLNISNQLKLVNNYPVPHSSLLKNLLSKYLELINKLKSDGKKAESKEKLLNEELQNRLTSVEKQHDMVCKEKDEIMTMLEELNEKHEKVLAKNEDISNHNTASATAQLKAAKDLVDLKLNEKIQLQQLYKQLDDMTSQLTVEQDRNKKLVRDLKFETKLHEELKTKHSKLKKNEEDLNEEYLNLKLNVRNLENELKEQKKHIVDQERMMSELLHGKQKAVSDNKDNTFMQIQDFVGHVKKMTSMLTMDNSDDRGTNSSVNLPKALDDLENQIKTLSREKKDKEGEVKEMKKEMAAIQTNTDLLQEDNSHLKRNVEELNKALDTLSKNYHERLNMYINNVKDFVTNNNVDVSENLEKQMKEMFKGKEDALLNDVVRCKENIKQVEEEKSKMTLRLKKLMVAYRTLCDQKGVAGADALPSKEEAELFQMKKEMELQEKLKFSQNHIQQLQTKLGVIESMQSNENRHDVTYMKHLVQPHLQNLQVEMEKEKAELISRCIIAEQEAEGIKTMLNEEVESLQSEVAYLRQFIHESAPHPQQQIFHSTRLPPLRRSYHQLPR